KVTRKEDEAQADDYPAVQRSIQKRVKQFVANGLEPGETERQFDKTNAVRVYILEGNGSDRSPILKMKLDEKKKTFIVLTYDQEIRTSLELFIQYLTQHGSSLSAGQGYKQLYEKYYISKQRVQAIWRLIGNHVKPDSEITDDDALDDQKGEQTELVGKERVLSASEIITTNDEVSEPEHKEKEEEDKENKEQDEQCPRSGE
ncbi:unnamed protein product, partial [Didymodactylos carnosus]